MGGGGSASVWMIVGVSWCGVMHGGCVVGW